ncbi:ATP-dependent bile acid permease [Penicillium malachiteum]|uniref:ATP-dependent bile acid permease n=1 Tax=Penicillium malachiteum TaxID=1324776 RepID=UPI0025495E63|nr:ATP-dependent bile acid permease [Penicillium malachiteum]KAJ5725679.1 ATP-dependent bile acid permease [Penicillium malachiteum]
MKGRTCILTTHHSQLVLPHCDYAIVLDGGRIKGQGTASDLVNAGLMEANIQDIQAKDNIDLSETPQTTAAHSPDSMEASSDGEIEGDGETSDLRAEPEYTEEMSTGAVPPSVIRTYLTSMGSSWFWMILMLLGFALQQVTSLGTNLWIKRWAHEFDKLEQFLTAGQDPNTVNSSYCLAIYGLIYLSYVLTSFIRDLTTFSGALKASARIFDNFLDSILHTPLTFFDEVPSGQIPNLFSRDVSAIDQEVAVHSMSTFYTFCSLATILILISAIVPMFLPVAAFICFVYYIIFKVYINSARDLKRLEAVQQSPLYQHFGEAVRGYISIRAYGQVARFTKENHCLIDSFNQPYVLLWAAKQWLTVRVACLSALISWLTGIFLLWRLDHGTVNPGIAGLVLTYAATFPENVLWLVQLHTIVQQSFNSVDRVTRHTKISSESSESLEESLFDLSPK